MSRSSPLRALPAFVAATVLVALGACSSTSPEKSASGRDRTATETSAAGEVASRQEPRRSAGCGGGDVAAGTTPGQLTSGGIERTYRRFVPEAYDGETPLPLVVNLHGITSNADQQEAVSKYEELAAEEGVVVLTPNGAGMIQFWNIIETDLAPDDVAFLDELIAATGEELCIDESRVTMVGLSNGALMATLFACRKPDVVAAVAGVAAVLHPEGCDDAPAVPVLAMHGDADPVVLPEGGLGATVKALLDTQLLLEVEGGLETQRSLIPTIEQALAPPAEAVAAWAAQLDCAAEPGIVNPSPRVEIETWDGCADGASVVYYDLKQTGHVWPRPPGADGGLGAFSALVGPDLTELDATRVTWDFVSQYRR